MKKSALRRNTSSQLSWRKKPRLIRENQQFVLDARVAPLLHELDGLVEGGVPVVVAVDEQVLARTRNAPSRQAEHLLSRGFLPSVVQNTLDYRLGRFVGRSGLYEPISNFRILTRYVHIEKSKNDPVRDVHGINRSCEVLALLTLRIDAPSMHPKRKAS